MTIKDYIRNHHFNLLNLNHEGLNYEFENVRQSKHLCSSIYIIFDEKFVLKKMCGNLYKLLDFCRLEEFTEQIDKIFDSFYYNFFEIEMLDKNDKSYIVQFVHSKYCTSEKSTLKIFEKRGVNYILSNPYGPAFVSFKNYEIVKTEFYLSSKQLNEFEIEVLKAIRIWKEWF